MTIQFAPHQQRVVDEHRELTEKLNKLQAFMTTEQFLGGSIPEIEKHLLRLQAHVMGLYAGVLLSRIELFIASAS